VLSDCRRAAAAAAAMRAGYLSDDQEAAAGGRGCRAGVRKMTKARPTAGSSSSVSMDSSSC